MASDDVLNATPATYLSSLDARLRFSSADLPPGTNPLQFEVWMWPQLNSEAWEPVAFGNQTPTSIDVTGIPAGGLYYAPTFQAGQAATVASTMTRRWSSRSPRSLRTRRRPLATGLGS